MRQQKLYVLLISLAFVASSAFALAPNKIFNDLTVFLQSSTELADAIDDVISYITAIRQGVEDQQSRADDKNEEDQNTCSSNIEGFQYIVNNRSQELSDVTAHLEYLNGELTDTSNNIDYLNQRFNANEQKTAVLKATRCEKNFAFVMQLKQHKAAQLLLQQLEGILREYFSQTDAANQGALVQKFSSITERLQAYIQLFAGSDAAAILAQQPRTFEELTDSVRSRSSDDIGSGHVDNTRDVVQIAETPKVESLEGFSLTLEDRVLSLIGKLRDHLLTSIENLQNIEIEANLNFADYLASIHDEQVWIQSELDRKNAYLVKLNIDIATATTVQTNTQGALDNALAVLHAEEDRCQALRDHYAETSQRRGEELSILAQLEEIFNERISNMADFVRTRGDEYVNTGEFSSNNIGQRVVEKARA